MRTFAKRIVFAGSRCMGLNAAMRRITRRRLLVLCYHGVVSEDLHGDHLRGRNAICRSVFCSQMKYIARKFTPVSAYDVLDFVNGRLELPRHSVLVTFDDGFRNNLINAVPELERLGIPAVIHVVTGLVGTSELLWTQEIDERVIAWKNPTIPMPCGAAEIVPQEPNARERLASRIRSICKSIADDKRSVYLKELRLDPLPQLQAWQRELYDIMNWDELRLLSQKNIAIGSHSVTHPILSRLSQEQLENELTESKRTIEEELGQQCPWIAYPNGGPNDYTRSVIAAVRDAGYQIGFTLADELNSTSLRPLEIRRMCIGADLALNAFRARVDGLLEIKNLVGR